MKKVLLLFLALTLSFTLAACRDEDRTSPVFSGVDDITIFLDADFDPLEGVTAVDHDGNDISEDITVNGSVNTSEVGTTYLRYRVEDSRGYYTEAARYVTVEVDPDELGDEMVRNGDFSLGMSFWSNTTGLEGGNATFTVVDGELKVEITSVSGGLWEPRLENQGITFENGKIYELTFEARAEAPRAIHVQVGELLTAAPWFLNFKPGVTSIFDLTTEMEEYSVVFLMDLDTNENGAVIFEMGTVPGTIGTDNLLTTVYFDNVAVNEVDPADVEDDVPPVISGATNKTISLGSSFDPLEGVTVNDNIDGEIELTLDHITGTVNVDELGEYILIYTVSDAAGNETVVERKITVVEPDDSVEGADYGWRMFLNDWDGTAGNMKVIDGELVLTMQNINVWENWQVQIIQDAYALGTGGDNEGSLQFEEGKTYRVTFDARASLEGEGTLQIGYDIDGWTAYFTETFDVTEDMQTFTFEFTLDDTEMDYTTLAQFKLELGSLFAGEDPEQRFFLDNVNIEVQDDEDEYEDTGLIVNGNFDAQTVIEYSYGWRTFLNDWEGTSGFLSVVNGELVLNLENINTWENWQIQIIQDKYALGTGEDNEGSMELEAGETYRVTFDARATVEGDVNLAIGHAGDGWTEYYAETFGVTTDMETYTFTFTLDDSEMDYTTLAQFKLEMGNLFSGEEGPQQFFLDNVTLEIEEGEDFVDAEQIVNGDFTYATLRILNYGWRTFLNDWEGTSGAIVIQDGQLVLRLDSISNLTDNWKVQLIQDNFAKDGDTDNEGSIPFEADKTYRITFDAKASIEGEVVLAIGHSEGEWTEYFSEAFDVTEEMETFTFEFTLDDSEMDYTTLAQFKIEMGTLFSGEDAPQTFTLDNVIIEVQDGEDFVDAGFIVNGNFSGYVVHPE